MANTKPAPLTYLPEQYGEEIPATNIATQEALQTLLDALEARQKPRFDPRMLALAEGFLGPTKTGSGFEAIGRAAGKYREADELERQKDVELAQQRLGIIGQMAEIEKRKQRDRDFQNVFGTTPDPVPAKIGQEVDGSDRFAPPGISGIQGVKVMEGNPALLNYRRNFNAQDIYLRSLYKEGKVSLSEALKQEQEFQAKAVEMQRKRYEVRDDGVIDLATGLRYAFPKGDLVERQIVGVPGVSGTYKIPSNIAQQMDVFQALGDQEGYIRAARRALHLEDVEAAPSVAAPKSEPRSVVGRIKSEREKTIELETEKTLASELAKTEAEQQTAIVNEGRRAGSTIQLGNQLIQLASAPDANEIYGLARNDKNLMAMFTSLIGSGIQLGGGYSIAIPEIADIYRTFKLTPDQQQRYQYALQKFREMAIKMSEFAKGSVSNYEQTLFSQASINENDLPGTIRMKAEAMRARAEFEKERAELLRAKDPNGTKRFKTTDDLYDSAEYQNLVKKLDNKYETILEQHGILKKAQQVTPTAPGGAGLTADQIRAERAKR